MLVHSDIIHDKKQMCFNSAVIPLTPRFAARDLVRYQSQLMPLPYSKKKMEKAYTACMIEITRWVSLGTTLNLSDLPDEERFTILRTCLGHMVMYGLVENTTKEMGYRRRHCSCILADRINNLYRANATSSGLKV